MINEDLGSTYNWEEPKWKYKLRAAGYDGGFDDLIQRMPETIARPAHFPEPHQRWAFLVGVYPPENPTHWRAGYALRNEIGPYSDGASPEEAVANLMIEHPELWRK